MSLPERYRHLVVNRSLPAPQTALNRQLKAILAVVRNSGTSEDAFKIGRQLLGPLPRPTETSR